MSVPSLRHLDLFRTGCISRGVGPAEGLNVQERLEAHPTADFYSEKSHARIWPRR